MGHDELKQLMSLKQITNMTGALHEAQVLHLKYYPLILTHCIKCEVNFMFEDKLVVYKLLKFDGPEPKDLKRRFNLLDQWVKTLLGSEYSVVIEGYEPQVKVSNGRSRVKKQVDRRRRRAKRTRK
jgi:hypothetical protein